VIRSLLLHIPVLGRYLERRWMPSAAERDLHRNVVRGRLHRPFTAEAPPDPGSASVAPRSASED
jgi:hypothetical protein